MKLQRRRENTERDQTIAPGSGNEHVGCRCRDELDIAVRQSRHRYGSARGQDMFEIDSFLFEVTFTLGDPDRREVQARGRSCQSDFGQRFGLSEARGQRAKYNRWDNAKDKQRNCRKDFAHQLDDLQEITNELHYFE
jgi:hypothetical protein